MRFSRLILMAVVWVLLLHPAIHAMDGHAHDLAQHQTAECVLCHIHTGGTPPLLIAQVSLTSQTSFEEPCPPALSRIPLQTRGRAPPAILLV